MHDEDLKLIRQIVASGGRKYTAGNVDRSKTTAWSTWVGYAIQDKHQRCRVSGHR